MRTISAAANELWPKGRWLTPFFFFSFRENSHVHGKREGSKFLI